MMLDTQKEKTRLLFVQTQAEAAGAQEISRVLGAELSRPGEDGLSDFDVHHLFLYRKTDGCDDFPNVHFAADPRPSGLVQNIKFVKRVFSLIRTIKPDVLLTFQHYGNIVAAPIGRMLGVPVIIANHVSPQSTISAPVAAVDKLIGLAGFYDKITVNSRETLRDYQAHPARYRRLITYVPHGFADKTSRVGKPAARARFGLPQDVALMGTVARLHPIKRLDLAIRLLPRLPEVHLALVGQGPDQDRLQAIGRNLGVSDRLHFVGEIASLEVGTFLAGLDVFVFPTSSETFGLAPVEAAQTGIPVVCTDLPIMREVLQVDNVPCAVFVDTTDPEAFADAVETVLRDETLHAHLSSLGKQLKNQHSLQGMVDGYRHLIHGLPVAVQALLQAATQL